MTKLLKRFAAVVIILVLLSLGLYKLIFSPSTKTDVRVPQQVNFPSSPATGSQDSRPEIFVRSFYTWYLENLSHDSLFPHPENRNEVLKPWLSDEYLVDWDQIQLLSESNPVLLTAGEASDWTVASTAIIEQTISSMRVRTVLVSGSEYHVLTVELKKNSDSVWKIYSINNGV